MRLRITCKRKSYLAVLTIAVSAMVALPVFLLPIGMREGTPADILVGRAYAAANPVDPEEGTVLIEDWAIKGESEAANPATEISDPDPETGEVTNELDEGLIILTAGETVGQTYIDGALPEEAIVNNYEGILTATVVQTYDSSDLPIELLDTQTFLSDNTTFYIKASGSIIKEKPNMDSGTVSKIALGTEVVRIGIGDTWSKIRTEEGTEGYVPSDTITEEMVFVAIDRTVWVDASGLKLRSEPSTASSIIRTLPRYTKLRCSGVSDKWFHVTTEDGEEGYVYISYTTKKAPPTPTPKPTQAPKKTTTTKKGKTGNTSSLPTITGVNGESVINVCKSMLGVEYKWNGETRDGVDCSGLVVYAYRQVGVGGIPHQSNSIKTYGVSVARSDIKLGDVVCYDIRGSSDSVEHVGIYCGGSQVIHASSTRDQVEYGNLDMYPIVSIRRLIQ